MRAPIVPTISYILEMDGTLGIHSHDLDRATIHVWVLQNYESEVWDFKYQIQLPVAEIRRKFKPSVAHWCWHVSLVSGDGDMILLVRFDWHLLHADSDGKLINGFNHCCEDVYLPWCRLKQSLVKHTFFAALEGYAVNAWPLVSTAVD
uniref:F-box associated domain-containing protein n=1 Tax=Hordeum vulgare subsp. vulgare TaxID=112509 RepID=A0A8I6WW48_HORVV